MSKVVEIGGRLVSKETGGVVTGANAILDDTKGKKQDVINGEVDAELGRLDSAKQNVLSFDNAPTEGSDNPVKSGGVFAADKALSDAIEAILVLIPSAASALNKLADMAFVNSTVSTNTATFRGTYNSVSGLSLPIDATHEQIATALGSVIATADNNDYAFVQVPTNASTPTEIAKTERYKFNGTNWGYEYDLNTSGFTAAQWDAINSSITAGLVAKLSALPTNQELTQALAGKQDNLTFDQSPTEDSTNPVTSGGVYAALAAIMLLVPSEATSSNKLADKAFVATSILNAIPAFRGTFTTAAELDEVTGMKDGDIALLLSYDSDGETIYTIKQYISEAWITFFALTHRLLKKPATTGTTGDYPYNGMGRVVLPKNIQTLNNVEKNLLTQDMFYKGEVGSRVPNTNTVFVIQYDFELAENITVPANCVLEFDGGSISGAHTLTGNNTLLTGKIQTNSVLFAGTFSNETLDITDGFGGALDFFGILRSFSNAKISLYRDIVVTTKDTNSIANIDLDGRGHTIKVVCMCFAQTADISIKNCKFDMSIAQISNLWNSGNEGGFIDVFGNTNNNISIVGCQFDNIPDELLCLYLREVGDIDVINTDFEGNLTSESVYSNNGGCIFPYGVYHSVMIDDCRFRNINAYCIHFMQDDGDKDTQIMVQNCSFDKSMHGAIVGDGGIVRNCTIFNNKIKDTAYVGSSVAEDNAINFHGFENLRIIENYIDTPNSQCFNIDGSKSGETGFPKGSELFISENKVVNSKGLVLWVVKNATLQNNILKLITDNQVNNYPIVLQGQNVKVLNNSIESLGRVCVYLQRNGTLGSNVYDYLIDGNILNCDGGVSDMYTFISDDSDGVGNTTIVFGQNSIKHPTKVCCYSLGRGGNNVKFLYKREVHMVLNLSKVQRIPLCINTNQTAIGCKILAYGNITVSTDPVTLHFGYIDSSSIAETGFIDTSRGTMVLPTSFTKGVHEIDVSSNTIEAPCYIYNPGGGNDVDFDVVFEVVEYQKRR